LAPSFNPFPPREAVDYCMLPKQHVPGLFLPSFLRPQPFFFFSPTENFRVGPWTPPLVQAPSNQLLYDVSRLRLLSLHSSHDRVFALTASFPSFEDYSRRCESDFGDIPNRRPDLLSPLTSPTLYLDRRPVSLRVWCSLPVCLLPPPFF